MCGGATIFFLVVEVSKKGIRKKMCIFVFLSFLCWRKKTRKGEITENESKNNSHKKVFLGGCEQKRFLQKRRKMANTICVRKVKTRPVSLIRSAFLEMILYLWPCNITKHYKKWGFGRHRVKPKMALWFQKCHFGKGPRKAAFLSVMHKSCALLKTLFL